MLTLIGCILVLLFLVFLLFWPGFILQRIFVDADNFMEVVVFSAAFGIAFLVLLCPVLDVVWNVSLLSVAVCTILFSGVYFLKGKKKFIFPDKWEVLLLILIFLYGFLLRFSGLLDSLPRGQDAWVHISFIQYTYETHELPQFIPWAEPPRLVTFALYPPGSHCLAALLAEAFGRFSFSLLRAFFIAVGAASIFPCYVVVKSFYGRKVGLLSSVFVAVFTPHIVMTTEITAQALSIFLYPLIIFLFYKEKWIPSGILLGAVILVHHFSAFVIVISLATVTLVFLKKRYLLLLAGVSALSVGLSSPWWLRIPIVLVSEAGVTEGPQQMVTQGFFDPYLSVVSPLFIFLTMIGFFVLLREKKRESFFIIAWALVLFVASQPAFPVQFLPRRFPAFFIFPGSVMSSLGILELRRHVRKFFVFILILMFFNYPVFFWPSTGEENLVATQWVQNTTLDSIFYVYGWNYVYVYPLSQKKIYEISDFDHPFNYKGGKTSYFYDDSNWVPHDVNRFGRYDKVYSCFGVVIHRIE